MERTLTTLLAINLLQVLMLFIIILMEVIHNDN